MRPPICDKTVPPHLENPGSATEILDLTITFSLWASLISTPHVGTALVANRFHLEDLDWLGTNFSPTQERSFHTYVHIFI